MLRKPFFAILDGALNYDCSTCNAACCRGGYGTGVMHGREWENLKEKYPMLSHFAIDQGKYIFIINYGPKCFFLNKQNLCQIQQEYHRSEKPLQCRIFPYQISGQIQNRAVIQSALLCPFDIDEHLQGNIRKENFYKEIGNTSAERIYDIFDTPLTSYLADDHLLLEEKIIAISAKYFQSADIQGFFLEQIEISRDLLIKKDLIKNKAQVSSLQIMDKIIRQQAQFLKIDPKALDFDKADIARSLIALSPILRISMLKKHPYFQIGYLLALYLYALISKQIHCTPATVQSMANIHLQLGGKLEYLASFPFFMIPQSPGSKIRDIAKNLLNSQDNNHNIANISIKNLAFQYFLDDLIEGKPLGSAACQRFDDVCEFSKNQLIEYYIHHLVPFFIPSLSEDAFVQDEKESNLCLKK